MGSRGGGGKSGGGVQEIPAASRKMVQSLKEIVNGASDAEIYSMLKDCNMDPNETVNRLLSQDPFHEVKSKREKKKELKDTTESRPRGGGGGGTSNRGGRSGTDRFSGRGGSTHFSSSESGSLPGKPTYRRDYGTGSYPNLSVPASGVAVSNASWHPPTYSDSLGIENKASTFSATDGTSVSQPSSGYQSAWLGVPGQKSMADIVRMGRPQNKAHNTSYPYQQSINHNKVSDIHPENDVSPDDEWPSIEQPQAVNVLSVMDAHEDSELTSSHSNLPYQGSQGNYQYFINEAQAEDVSSLEDDVANHVGPVLEDVSGSVPLNDNDLYKNVDSYHPQDHAYEETEDEEGDVSVTSVSENMQQLNIQEEKHMEQTEEDGPYVVIPDHLQVKTANCSHLTFGSFGANMNTGFSGSFASRTLGSNIEKTPTEADTSSVEHSVTRNPEYYGEESISPPESNLVHRTGGGAGNYNLPSASQTEVLNQENSEATHGNQYSFPSSTPDYTFDTPQLLNPSLPQPHTLAQMQNSSHFSNVMQATYTSSSPSTLLAANDHPVRESDMSYSQFPISQSMATKYGGSAISMAEALQTAGFSSSQPTQQTPPPGNSVPTGPALPPHLAVHPYSQPGPFANMIGYPFLPQNYTYMPSGFQQAFAGNSTYHQQLAAAIFPQYKNNVSVNSLPQSAAVASGYASFGSQPAGPTGSTLSYDDVLNAHYKDNNQLLSHQQNENSGMWVHGSGSRTLPPLPANPYYSLLSQSQQPPSSFRQGQQPSQTYTGATQNYPNFYHTQTGISQDHHQLHLQQNPRDGSQGQPKQQSQQLWQNGY